MAFVNQITLPQEILDRIDRVLEYHESTKLTYDSVRTDPLTVDPAKQPYEFRVFEMRPKMPLPTGLLDIAVPTIDLMMQGLEALPPSQVGPPQDLKTLATWLHFANGVASKRRTVTQTVFTRTVASDGGDISRRDVRRGVCSRGAFQRTTITTARVSLHYASSATGLRRWRG